MKLRLLSCFALACVCSVAAHGQSTLGPLSTTFTEYFESSGSIVLPGFDSSLGTLSSVSIDLSGVLTHTVKFENLSTNSGSTATWSDNDSFTVSAPSGLSIANVSQLFSGKGSVLKFDNVLDFSGSSGFIQVDTKPFSSSAVDTAVAAYLGSPVSIDFAFVAADPTGGFGFTGGNASYSTSNVASGTLSVTYTYTPIPEPATMAALLGVFSLAVASIAGRRRLAA